MFCAYAVTFPTFGPCKQRNSFFSFFLILFFFFVPPLLTPLPPPLSCQLTQRKCGTGWASLMSLFERLSFLVEKGWEGVLVVSQSWSSQEEFPFLSSFALAVSQLSFLQISALVASLHKNTCGSKDSEEALFGASFSCSIPLQTFTVQTFVPASADQSLNRRWT